MSQLITFYGNSALFDSFECSLFFLISQRHSKIEKEFFTHIFDDWLLFSCARELTGALGIILFDWMLKTAH